MIINEKKLINLPVFTQSGQHLGKVVDFEIEVGSHTILKYYVKSSGLINELFTSELIITPSQVIEITKEKMIVEDNIIRSKESVFKKKLAEDKPVVLT